MGFYEFESVGNVMELFGLSQNKKKVIHLQN